MADRLSAARGHLRQADAALAGLIDEHPDFDPRVWLTEMVPTMDAFGALIFQVAGQELSVISARAIVARTQEAFGGHLPAPRELLDTEPELLLKVGFSHSKVATLCDLARRFVAGDFSEQAFAQMPDQEIEDALTVVRGVGPWTVRGFLIIYLDRPDVLPVGDVSLRRAVRRVYDLDQLPDKEQLEQIAERWRPYRTLAVMYLQESEYKRQIARSPLSRSVRKTTPIIPNG
jgi:DNA-3-methyladenine glycosylase II